MRHILKIIPIDYWGLPMVTIDSIHVGNFPDAFREELGVISFHWMRWPENKYHIEFSSNEKMMNFQLKYL
jgi:hypothetical protein